MREVYGIVGLGAGLPVFRSTGRVGAAVQNGRIGSVSAGPVACVLRKMPLLDPQNGLGLGPVPLELVELALRRSKYVNDDRAEVDQRPM